MYYNTVMVKGTNRTIYFRKKVWAYIEDKDLNPKLSALINDILEVYFEIDDSSDAGVS